MSQQKTTTPPLSLIEQWKEEWECYTHVEGIPTGPNQLQYIATQAARWGADQELEACCEWFLKDGWNPEHPTNLRAARRSKPQSLKEQALKELRDWTDEKHGPGREVFCCEGLCVDTIRRALESLPD